MGAILKALLVEDDFDVAAGLAAYLESRGIGLEFAYSISGARNSLRDGAFDIVIMDVQLPDGSGVELCRELKASGLETPVIFLTALGTLKDRLGGFDAGGTDYMVKPFAPAELLARIRALTQHSQRQGGLGIRAGGYHFDPLTGLLTGNDREIVLEKSARKLLRRMMEASPGSANREELMDALWGDDIPESTPLRMHIHQMRALFTAEFGHPLIETVRGVGYRFVGNS
ncbi:response regulator transcription factor [Altererythrobacter sp. Z27]|uniref:response regulator transcription factor n=1 Tax=Altererythrobacter sp. Z27 TaxID=3461147 RepID=UPI0040443939